MPKRVNEIETPAKYSQTAYLLSMNELIEAIFSLQIKKVQVMMKSLSVLLRIALDVCVNLHIFRLSL